MITIDVLQQIIRTGQLRRCLKTLSLIRMESKETLVAPLHANIVESSRRVFSREEVDRAIEGKRRYGFKRYLQLKVRAFSRVNGFGQAHEAATNTSRELLLTFCRALQI